VSEPVPSRPLLEVCVDRVETALVAAAAGADRIEFCARLDLGGITPVMLELERVLDLLEVPVFAMVRPRGGDFVYDARELRDLTEDLRAVRECGANGVVLGVLGADGRIARETVAALRAEAGDLPLTFHRAFDELARPLEGIEALLELGVDRLLTTGGPPTAWEGRDVLRELVQAAGDQLVVMPGGGVRQDHVHALLEHTGAREVHSSQVLIL